MILPVLRLEFPSPFIRPAHVWKMNPDTQSHSLVCVSTGAGHEGTVRRVTAVGLLLCRRTQKRRRGRGEPETDLVLPLHSQIQHHGHPQCGAHSRYGAESYSLPLKNTLSTRCWNNLLKNKRLWVKVELDVVEKLQLETCCSSRKQQIPSGPYRE